MATARMVIPYMKRPPCCLFLREHPIKVLRLRHRLFLTTSGNTRCLRTLHDPPIVTVLSERVRARHHVQPGEDTLHSRRNGPQWIHL